MSGEMGQHQTKEPYTNVKKTTCSIPVVFTGCANHNLTYQCACVVDQSEES